MPERFEVKNWANKSKVKEVELTEIQNWFDTTDPPTLTNKNMIHHNGMATYHLTKAVKILRRFDKENPAWNRNNQNITDEHYKALFLMSLLYGADPVTGYYARLNIKSWYVLPENTRDNYKKFAKILVKTYQP